MVHLHIYICTVDRRPFTTITLKLLNKVCEQTLNFLKFSDGLQVALYWVRSN